MAGLRTVSREERLGARRWDAVVVGSGISALVAVVRLGMAGHRVLVVEEDRARDAFAATREPFFLAGAREQGLLDLLLRELTMPLIERRRLEKERLAMQIVGPELRLDVGEPQLCAHELVAWGLSKPEAAQAIVRSLCEAAEAERQAMLAAPVVRAGRRLPRPRPGSHGSHVRGLPAEAARPEPGVAAVMASQVAVLANLAITQPGPEARARLLGSLMGGAAGFGGAPPWLSGLLRRRAEAVHAEFRSVAGGFEIVDNDGEAGLMTEAGQLWLGRAVVLAAPESALAQVIQGDRWPLFLDASRPCRRRLALHLRCKTAALPEGMGRRIVSTGADDGLGDVTVSLYASDSDTNVEIVARALSPTDPRQLSDGEVAALENRLEERIHGLIPFAGRRLSRRPFARPLWDDDDWLEDPPPGQGWPAEIDVRVNTGPPVYRLERAGVAGLGLEGDLLLGWRGGDAIAAEL